MGIKISDIVNELQKFIKENGDANVLSIGTLAFHDDKEYRIHTDAEHQDILL